MKKRTSHAASVGVIGGTDGPTAIFTVSSKEMEKRRSEQEAFLNRAQKLAEPCAKSFDETIRYLCAIYGAQPCDLSRGQRQSVKVNILLNEHPELVHRQPIPENPTETQMREWCRQDISFDQALAFPEERLGLQMEGYRIPEEIARTLREKERKNEPSARKNPLAHMLERWAEWWRGNLTQEDEGPEPLVVLVERTHEYLASTGRAAVRCRRAGPVQGIREEDIRDKTPRFIAYAYLMDKMAYGNSLANPLSDLVYCFWNFLPHIRCGEREDYGKKY